MHILWWMGSKFCVKFQRCPLKFHPKFWTHTQQNMYFTRCQQLNSWNRQGSLIIPFRFNEVERGVYWFHVVRLFISPSVRPSVDGIMSAQYLQQYLLDPLHIYASGLPTQEGVSHVNCLQNSKISIFDNCFKFVTFTSSCFDFGSNMKQ